MVCDAISYQKSGELETHRKRALDLQAKLDKATVCVGLQESDWMAFQAFLLFSVATVQKSVAELTAAKSDVVRGLPAFLSAFCELVCPHVDGRRLALPA